jgi:hypothetical protein
VSRSAALVPLSRTLRLGLAGAVASRSLLAATFAWVLVLAAVYASDAGPPLTAAAFTAAVLLPVGAWATAAFLGSLSDDLRALLTAANGRRRVFLADGLLPALWVAGAGVVGVLAGLVFDPRPDSLVHRGLALLLHLLCGAVGVALGLALHAAGLSRGTQLVVVVVATVVSGRLRWLPPGGPVLAAWGADRSPAAGLAAWSLLGPVVVAGLLLAFAARLRRRRS